MLDEFGADGALMLFFLVLIPLLLILAGIFALIRGGKILRRLNAESFIKALIMVILAFAILFLGFYIPFAVLSV
jgi:predicted small integral membrane protein